MKTKFYLLTFLLGLLFASCGASKEYSPAYGDGGGKYARMEDGSGDQLYKERKILYSASLLLAVENPDSSNVKIGKIAQKYHGYVSQTGTSQTTIRVKSEELDQAVAEISALGKLQNKNLTGQDVTEEFMDYEIRLENAEKARARYLELLAKAENVEAALLVEKELERLNGIIDLMKGKMTRIEHLEAFSTITVNLKERKKPGVLGYVGIGLYHAVKWLFVRN